MILLLCGCVFCVLLYGCPHNKTLCIELQHPACPQRTLSCNIETCCCCHSNTWIRHRRRQKASHLHLCHFHYSYLCKRTQNTLLHYSSCSVSSYSPAAASMGLPAGTPTTLLSTQKWSLGCFACAACSNLCSTSRHHLLFSSRVGKRSQAMVRSPVLGSYLQHSSKATQHQQQRQQHTRTLALLHL